MMKKKKSQFFWRRLIWIAVWILSLVTISFYGGSVSYGFFYAVTLLPFISFLYLALVFWLFRVYQRLEERNVICGQSTPYLFVLRNEGYFPFVGVSVTLHSFFSQVENMEEDTEYELLRGDEHVLKTNLICKYRGEYEVGVKEIIVTDFFRLFRFKYREKNPIRPVVKPKLTHISRINSIDDILDMLQKETVAKDTEPDVLVRDYVPGDGLRQVSWKLSAREQKLKIRNRIGEEKQGIVLVCDMKRYSGQIMEYIPLESKMLEIMVALGLHLTERDMGFEAYYSQKGLMVDRVDNMKGFEEYYEHLSKVRFSKEYDFTRTITEAAAKGNLWNARILFGVVHEVTKETLEFVTQLSDAGIVVVLYVVTDESCDVYMEKSSRKRKIVPIEVEAELEGKL